MGAVFSHRGHLLAVVTLFVLFFCTRRATRNLHIHRKKPLPFGIAEPLCLLQGPCQALPRHRHSVPVALMAEMDSTGLMGDSILSRVGWRNSDL